MRRKILIVVSMLGLIASIAGCGVEKEDEKIMNVEAESVQTQTTENNNVDIEEIEKTESEDKTDIETVYNEEDYTEERDIFVYKNIDSGDGTQIDFTNEEQVNGPFILQESIDIYSYFFTYAGYTKPNIRVSIIRRVGDWVFIPFAQSSFLVKAEDFDRVAVLKENENSEYTENNTDTEIESPPTPEVPTQTENSTDSGNETPVASDTNSQTEVAVTTYSEEEVISIFRSTLESNGIQWYPDVYPNSEAGPSGGMGWGIENISMTDPYGDSVKSVEGFQFTGWNLYYLESQGSSNGYVHLKLYSGTN